MRPVEGLWNVWVWSIVILMWVMAAQKYTCDFSYVSIESWWQRKSLYEMLEWIWSSLYWRYIKRYAVVGISLCCLSFYVFWRIFIKIWKIIFFETFIGASHIAKIFMEIDIFKWNIDHIAGNAWTVSGYSFQVCQNVCPDKSGFNAAYSSLQAL